MKINVGLLRKVQKFLLAEPRRFDMEEGIVLSMDAENILENPPCGTACCIAGATYIVASKIKKPERMRVDWCEVKSRAELSLGISDKQAASLFYIPSIHSTIRGWAPEFEKAYLKAKTPLQRAKVGVAVIEDFIRRENEL